MEYLQKLKEELEMLKAQRAEVVQNGQSYSISGSHSVVQAKLAEIDEQIRRVCKKIAIVTGTASGRLEGVRYV